jgi:hypothetical protein
MARRIWKTALFTLALAGCADDDADLGDDTEGSSGTTSPTSSTSSTSSTTDASASGSSSSTTGTTSGSTGEDTDGGSTGGTGGEAKPDLGATPNVLCEASTALMQTIIDENAQANPDAAVIEEAYLGMDGTGTALQDFVRFYGAWLGRVEDAVLLDDQAILTALSGNPTDEDLVDVETTITTLMSLAVRGRLGQVASALPDADRDPAILYAQWDDAYCYWDAILRPLAQEADAEGIDTFLGIEEEIDAGFLRGHDGIEGVQPWAPDEFELPPAEQMVEKSTFRMWDRLLDKYALEADTNNDALAARRTFGYFQAVEDRFLGKNTCAIATIESMLTGNLANIDAAAIAQELNITWAKRTRGYATHAIDNMTVGTAEGYAGSIEGRTYVKAVLYEMSVDPATHMQLWEDWAQAILDDDFDAAQTASTGLTTDICAYHTTLGLADCTPDDLCPN